MHVKINFRIDFRTHFLHRLELCKIMYGEIFLMTIEHFNILESYLINRKILFVVTADYKSQKNKVNYTPLLNSCEIAIFAELQFLY